MSNFKHLKFFSICLFAFLLFSACNNEENVAINPAIMPIPAFQQINTGVFEMNNSTGIVSNDKEFTQVADFLKSYIKVGSSIDLKSKNYKNVIAFKKDVSITNTEGYSLKITSEKIEISASSAKGAFYAVQSLRQLLPASFEDSSFKKSSVAIQNLEIKDAPRFKYRGMHLDVGRHFFPVDFIKKYIDLISMLKMNTFHWHLTEDQGWRIEIKKYPKLQEIAAYRKETLIDHYSTDPQKFDGKKYGGFYTQEEIKDIVKYASERQVDVIPEIEMPGHAQAAIAAYPELGCTGKQIDVATKWGIFEDIYCPKEATFKFLEDVIDEVIALFPGKYIHIGGDEAPKTRWKNCNHCQKLIKKEGLKDAHGLQSYFITRMEKYINAKGKQIIGWDEILEGGLAPNATVMSWRGITGAIQAAKQHHDVILTPNSHCYFDHYQSTNDDEPLAIGGFLPLEKVYSYEPIPSDSLTKDQEKHILGAQGNLWTEYITTPNVAEYMAFPRALAFAEVNWSPKSARDYDNFTTRLGAHFKRLDAMGVNYAKHIFDVTANLSRNEEGKLQVDLNSKNQQGKIHFTTDGDIPTPDAPIYEKPILLGESNKVYAALFENNNPTANSLGNMLKADFITHKAAIRKITTNFPASKSFGKGDSTLLVNGVLGNQSRFNDGQWLGWQGKNLEAVIDLGALTPIESITLRFFKSEHQWIYYPKKATISFSHDNETFVKVGEYSNFTGQKDKVLDVIYDLKTNVQYIKVSVDHYGIIPEGRRGGGENAWFFMDEIVVQ